MYEPSRQELERQIREMRHYLNMLADNGDRLAAAVLAHAATVETHHICGACCGTGVAPSMDGIESAPVGVPAHGAGTAR